MKSKSVRAAVCLTILLAAFLLLMSCGPGPQSNNQGQNQNQNQNSNQATGSGETALAADGACNLSDVNAKISEIKLRIVSKMSNDLKQQHNGNTNEHWPPRFKFDVVQSPDGNYLEAYFETGVSGVDGLKDLADVLNDFKKDRCLLKVYFVPEGTLPLSTAAPRMRSFDWTACEWPQIPCPNGECSKACPSLSPSPRINNSNTNTHPNVNSPSNRE